MTGSPDPTSPAPATTGSSSTGSSSTGSSSTGPYTTSTALLEALREAGVRYVFANLGSDHTGILEAYALARGWAPWTRCPTWCCARTRAWRSARPTATPR